MSASVLHQTERGQAELRDVRVVRACLAAYERCIGAVLLFSLVPSSGAWSAALDQYRELVPASLRGLALVVFMPPHGISSRMDNSYCPRLADRAHRVRLLLIVLVAAAF
jgi:hypothetical protein